VYYFLACTRRSYALPPLYLRIRLVFFSHTPLAFNLRHAINVSIPANAHHPSSSFQSEKISELNIKTRSRREPDLFAVLGFVKPVPTMAEKTPATKKNWPLRPWVDSCPTGPLENKVRGQKMFMFRLTMRVCVSRICS
jgi:hypothetical protein